MVQLIFENVSANNGFVTTKDAQKDLNIEWQANPDTLYTVIMHNLNTNKINLLVTNIKGMDVKNGDTIIPYQPPNVPANSFPSTFVLSIYRQEKEIPIQANIINMDKFIDDNKLVLVDNLNFKVGSIIPTASSAAKLEPTKEKSPKDSNYFKPNADLSDQEKKWCRCVLKVSAKQPSACNIEKAWFEKRDGETCYNPYAVCSKSVGTSTRKCGENYDFESLSDSHLKAYAELHQKGSNQIEIPIPYNRTEMLENIKKWKAAYK